MKRFSYRQNENLTEDQIVTDFKTEVSHVVRNLSLQYNVEEAFILNLLEQRGLYSAPIERKVRAGNVGRGNKIELPPSFFEDYQAGMSMTNLANKYNVSVMTVNRKVKEAGIYQPRSVGSPKGTGRISLPSDAIISDYEAGMSLESIGEKYGVNWQVVRRRLIDEGAYNVSRKLKSKGKGVSRKRVDLPLREVLLDYEKGIPLSELGEKYGVSYQTIIRKLKKAGLYKPRKIKKGFQDSTRQNGDSFKFLVSDFMQGASLSELSHKYGYSENFIYNKLEEYANSEEGF